MYESNTSENEFLAKLSSIIEINIANPKFGVSMLAREMGMSRSNLHRKVNEITRITVSQFINQVRLKKAKEILRHTPKTVSEVAYEVGFNNVSYFIKCFHEYYGYSPGEVGNREETRELSNSTGEKKHLRKIYIAAIAVALIGVVVILVFKPLSFQQKNLESSIIMLPMDNWETNDLITINGILESIRDNLCKISEIDMKPSVSVLRSSNSPNSNLEIAQKFKANYLIQPKTWQPPGKENIYLALDIIEVQGNTHVKTINHELDSTNITTVHINFTTDICDALNVTISNEEQTNIEKPVTTNNTALKHYHSGLDYLRRPGNLKPNLEEALKYFKKAVELDNQCAHAYASIAITYYYLDVQWTDFNTENHEILFRKEITRYADKAMQLNPKLELSLIAKALYYKNEKEYQMAIDYFEKVLEHKKNDYHIISHLVTLYRQLENREKSIVYALDIIQSVFPADYKSNSLGIERVYTQTSRSYRFLGFFKEAEYCVNEAIRINPDYTFASVIKSQVILDIENENNYQEAIKILKSAIKKDSIYPYTYVRVGQSYYMLKDYNIAATYYQKYMDLSGKSWTDNIDIQSKRLAVILREKGETEKALMQINHYRNFAESRTPPALKYFHLSGYYAFLGDTTKALECLKKSSNYDQLYHRLRQLRDDPVYDDIRELPQFQEIFAQMQTRWQEKQDSVREEFKKKGLLKIEM